MSLLSGPTFGIESDVERIEEPAASRRCRPITEAQRIPNLLSSSGRVLSLLNENHQSKSWSSELIKCRPAWVIAELGKRPQEGAVNEVT